MGIEGIMAGMEDQRPIFCKALAENPITRDPEHALFKHGRAYRGPLEAPTVTWRCKKPPRDDHSCPDWLTASEFSDQKAVRLAKVKQLAELLRCSKKTVLYTGAGISARAVGQAARSGQNKQGWECGDWMAADAETADLVLVLGTSLGGLSADCVATNSAYRSEAGQSLGSVMINLQQTPKDGMMTLRMFGKSDDILGMLVEELGLGPVATKQPKWPTKAALVPYDADGVRLVGDLEAPRMWLDLSTGQKVRLTPGHNIQGAKQRQFMHIGADKPVKINGKLREPE